ncbi:dTDP-D-glucose 4,6-dehydratase-like isoform X2 [Paramacrobiotus metropolitanus]|uniref:dTDP-D-glucose 4,6-dehydratase-like isoform X2 n=1 Tax=Paramacrobiotus metropolitanus TaxID=2943436 RepID=UPI002445A5A3|nr:dTDP-D-glucose 4,6-dehydratase-like isoform X2 [Paramacrobiotus metropolitanus]
MEQPTHVVHFAAAGNVDQSFSTPIECTNANVLGTHTLLECLRILKTAELFVYISTDEVYGETPEGSNSEGTMFSPTNPYAASKAAAECLVMSYGKSYNIPYIITRANNVYGPYQYPAQVIPKFTMQLLKKQRMPVHGNGNSVRRFVHVLDKCRAIETIMHRGSIGGTYNIGTEFEISVKQIASILLKKIVGKDEPLEDWISYVPDRPYNDCRYSVNCSKLHALGWKASVSFEDGITDLVQWYKDHQDHWWKADSQHPYVHPGV